MTTPMQAASEPEPVLDPPPTNVIGEAVVKIRPDTTELRQALAATGLSTSVPETQNTSIVMTVVISLALFALAGLGGVVWLVSQHAAGDSIALVATPMGVALGALGALLAKTTSTS